MNVTYSQYELLDRRDALLCLTVAVFTLALFFYFLTPPFLSDQLDYFYHAWQTNDLKPSHRHLRIGLVFPTWLAIRLFGYSELSYHAVPALGALLLALGTWLVGRMLFDRWVATFSALLVIYNPWVLTSFTDLLPDYLGAGLFTSATGFLLWRWRIDQLTTRTTRSTAAFLLFLLAGFLIGWSYLAREYVVIVFPVVVFVLMTMNGRMAAFVAVTLGAAACWSLELAWGAVRYADPLARLHAVASPRAVARFVETDVIHILLQFPHIFLERSGGLIFVLLLSYGMGSSVWRSTQGDRRWQLLALWLVGGWLFFTIIGLLPVILLGEERVFLRMHKFRYWALILPPTMIAGFAGAQQLTAYLAKCADPGGTRHARAWVSGVGVVVALACASLAVSSENYSGLVRNGTDDYEQFRKFVKAVEDADEIILLEHGGHSVSAVRSLPIYLNTWHGRDRVWQGRVTQTSTRDLDEIIRKPGRRLVAIDLSRAERLERMGRSPDQVLSRLERTGEKLFESSGGRVLVYLLDNKRVGGRESSSPAPAVPRAR